MKFINHFFWPKNVTHSQNQVNNMSSIFTFHQSKTLVNISKAFHLFGSLGERGLLPAPLSLSDPPVRYKGKIFFFFF